MKPSALDIIRDEHLAIAAVLFAFRHAVRQAREKPGSADFPLLRAALDYIVAYPDTWHHPKEDDYLFAALKGKSPTADKLIRTLTEEHVRGYPMIDALKTGLADMEAGGDPLPFLDAAEAYVRFEWAHMRREEDQLLPLAERLLSANEWEAIDTAFRENDNPLSGLRPKEHADQLYRRIIELAPSR